MSAQPQSWWVSIKGNPTGPLSEAEVKQQLADGNLQPDAYACRVGAEEWKRLSEVPDLAQATASSTGPQPPPPPDHTGPAKAQPSTETPEGESDLWMIPVGVVVGAILLIGSVGWGTVITWFGWAAVAVTGLGAVGLGIAALQSEKDDERAGLGVLAGICVVVALVAFWLVGRPASEVNGVSNIQESPDSSNKKARLSSRPGQLSWANEHVPPKESSLARLKVSWADATPELLPIAHQLTPQEQAALGLVVLATGADIYAARVYLRNTGNAPLRIFPENIRIHFAGESARVSMIDDSRFLRRTVLRPGESTSGLVSYTARVDIGATIRGGGGMLSYDDSTIQVTYD